MRVLYIVTAYSRHEGDVITPWLTETIRRLRERDVMVEVLAPSYRGLGDQEVGGVHVHRFRYAPARWEALTHDQTAPDRVRERPAYLGLVPGYVAAGSLAAARLARRGGFDLVHVHWPIPHGIMGLAAARAAGLPLVSTFHGVELTWVARQMPFLRPLLRRLIAASDAVTANSSHTAGLIREVHDRPVERIPFGAAVAAGAVTRPRQRRFGAEAWSPQRPFRLLFVGRLVERKGVRYLLDALARLPRPDAVRLDVVGSGPLLESLESHSTASGLAGRVHFHGFVAEAQLARLYEEADAFVLPAVVDAKGDVEGLGVVLIEAAGFGVPLVASAAGGIPDIVRHEETGLLVPPGDAHALAGAVGRLMEDGRLRERLARGAAEWVQERFSWDRVADDLAHLYTKLARTDVD